MRYHARQATAVPYYASALLSGAFCYAVPMHPQAKLSRCRLLHYLGKEFLHATRQIAPPSIRCFGFEYATAFLWSCDRF